MYVSVIIPFYRAEKTIVRAIQSVYAQGFIDFEVIICNDSCSSELEHLVSAYKEVKIVYNESMNSAANARKACITAATGKFLAFLDADDTWIPYTKLHQLFVLESSDHLLCASSYLVNNCDVPQLVKCYTKDLISRRELLRTCWVGNSSLVMYRDAFDFNLYPSTFKEDYNFLLNITRTHSIVYVDVPTFIYQVGEISASSDKLIEAKRQFGVLRNHVNLFLALFYFVTYMFYGFIHAFKFRYLRKRVKKVVFMGGFGNCLFQMYVGEFWRSLGYEIEYYDILLRKNWLTRYLRWPVHPPTILDIVERYKSFDYIILFNLFRAFIAKRFSKSCGKYWESYCSGAVIGYYQNLRYYDPSLLLIISERLNRLTPADLAKFEVVVHLRFTDSVWQDVSFDFPPDLFSSSPVLVVTDDRNKALSLLGALGIYNFILSDNSYLDFHYMRHSKVLFLSNSTFSWWAALTNPRLETAYMSKRLFDLLGFDRRHAILLE